MDHSNIELVSYSDPHCIWYLVLAKLENYIAFCQRPPKMFQLNSTSFNARCLQGGESFVAPGGHQLRKLSSTSLYLPSCHSLVLPLPTTVFIKIIQIPNKMFMIIFCFDLLKTTADMLTLESRCLPVLGSGVL